MKKVSVIIPTYNRADYLKFTLDSVVNQTYNDIEIIVVDDGSPNNETENLCKNYDSVKYLKIENSGGPATPRNLGLKESTGVYIAFLDDDDIWLPNKIEEQVEILNNSEDFGLVHCYCNVIDENGHSVNQTVGKPGSRDVKHGDVKLKMIGNWTLMMPTPLIRRSVIEQVGYFNETIPAALEDVEFWTRCSFYTKFYYIDKPLANYRQHANNISSFNKNYLNLPLYLKKVLVLQFSERRVSKRQYRKLLQLICFSQAKKIRTNPFKTLENLFKLKTNWFFDYGIVKVLIKKLFN